MLTGFPPIIDARARVLVLGSMPGEVSLRQGQYYAHPRNLFWRITAEVLRFDAGAAYEVRVAALREAGIGLWDVLHRCERSGSLDSAIVGDTLVPNDFAALFAAHPDIGQVFFNGAAAERMFTRLVLPGLGNSTIACGRLPSTSPANAALTYREKLQAWRAIAV
jgi:double-stranded uracil-DNA glycosylase